MNGKCQACGQEGLVSGEIGLCYQCVKVAPTERLLAPHRRVREALNLPPVPPSREGISCKLCSNTCSIPEGGRGFCGLRENQGGRLLQLAEPGVALAHTYYDPIPTNCCAAWFCSPCQKVSRMREVNLAVFFYGCNFDCLFCQNAQHKYLKEAEKITLEEFTKRALRPEVHCVCYFGGSPEPQFPFALKAAAASLEEAQKQGRDLRICWEWNGCGNKKLVQQAAELSLASGGAIKFDLKAWTENLSLALCGVSNRRAFENFTLIAQDYLPQANHHLLTATTLLVPGYVDAKEVGHIAQFIVDLNPRIPYSLLIFHSDFVMADLPITPLEQTIRCYHAAEAAGLEMVNVGNLHLLGLSTMSQFEQLVRSHYQ